MTLQGTTSTHAFFCVTKPEVDVTDTEVHPFVVAAQWFNVKQMVILPHWACHRLAEKAGDPVDKGRDLIYIQTPARAGSTLLCQIYSKLPRTRWLPLHVCP